MTDDLRIRKVGRAGRITLDRPHALNALSHAMALAVEAALDAWREDPEVALVVIDATGARAFCAGGDVAAIYAAGRRGDFKEARRFWADEYRMNAKIAAYPKPYVALTQGHVLGGGVGVALHGSHRIVGETSKVAMPECLLGLVPDVGGTHLLGQAPGRLGEFLGLTGHRMGPGDALHAGFADFYAPEPSWEALTRDLERSGDAEAIAAYAAAPPHAPLSDAADAIEDAFSAPDLAALLVRLQATAWGAPVAKGLLRQCPLSMACALALVRAARAEPGVEAALTREYRFTARSLELGDMMEGVRAQVIDKDHAPQWSDTLDSLTPARVAAMLAPLPRDWTSSNREE